MEPISVMLIDDNPDDLELISIALEEAGYEVVSFGNAESAIESIDTVNPDILISDTIMEGMEGVQTLETIKQLKPELPVIIISGLEHYLGLMLQLGADDVCQKSPTYAELVEKVDKILKA